METRTATGANPTYAANFMIAANSTDGSTITPELEYTITVEYWADLTIPVSSYAS